MNIKLFTQHIQIAMCLFFLMLSQSSFATINLRSWDTGKTIDFNDGLDWANTNTDVSLNIEFCVRSTSSNGVASPYAIRVGTVNPYSITSGTLPDLPVTIQYSEATGPGVYTGFQTLIPNTYTAQNNTGLTGCGGGVADNAVLKLSILNADLVAATAGTFTRVFTVTVMGGTGAETKSANLTVRLIIPPYMKISDVNDISFPYYDHINPLVASDAICIYRNNPGNYSVTARGSGAAFAFTLTNGVNLLPYTLTWNDSSTTAALTANTALLNRTNVFRNNTTCNLASNDNATMTLTISVANINAVPQATYTGILTIIIAPL